MKILSWLLIATLALSLEARAEVAPVSVRVPKAEAWTGQGLFFFVELRTEGPFAGTASFALPNLPGVLVLKIGSPVVSSEAAEGRSWIVQTHEFALFSQKAGPFDMPTFPVRFASHEGYTGPVRETQAEVPSWQAEIRRPPGAEKLGFLVTTESLDITETWEPQPGLAKFGAVFKRTIMQRASGIPGMALAPAPTAAPEGVRVYVGTVETPDKSERGFFLGERRETLTYLLQKPGTLTLPALAFTWWNPKSEQLQSTTLPSVSFKVAGPPLSWADIGNAWPWLSALAIFGGLGAWQRRRIAEWARQGLKTLNPPDRVAARRLLRACGRNDAVAAERAWMVWRNAQGAGFEPDSGLAAAVLDLQARLFRPAPSRGWQGEALARALREHLDAATDRRSPQETVALPPLNP